MLAPGPDHLRPELLRRGEDVRRSPTGETVSEVGERVAGALVEIADQAPDDATVVVTTLVAAVVNLLVHAGGSAAGATYEFTSDAGPARVDILTLMGFTTLPLLIGLAVAALLLVL